MPRLTPLALVITCVAMRAVAAETPVVQLPKVVVTESSLQEREHWRYTEVAGFEILSQADDTTIQQLAGKLQAMALVVKTIWPAPAPNDHAPTTIVLCNSDQVFSTFIPESVKVAMDSSFVDRLFLKDGAHEVIVFNCDRSGDSGRFKDIVRDYARRSLLALREPPPDWFVTGMGEVIADADYRLADGKLKLRYAELDKVTLRGTDKPVDLSAYETERPNPALLEIIRGALNNRSRDAAVAIDADDNVQTAGADRFNTYFAQSLYHPNFEEILKNSPAVHPDDYRMTCWAFVHLCAFAQQRNYNASLGKLLRLAGKKPGGDMVAMFAEAFHTSARSMGITVTDYSTSAVTGGVSKTLPFEAAATDISDAEPMLIGRIKADAYRLGGYPAQAEAEIAKARRLTHVAPAEPR